MARVFSIDILECPRCKSRMQLISTVQDPKAVRDILHSLKMSTAPPDNCELYDRTIKYDGDEQDHAADETLSSTEPWGETAFVLHPAPGKISRNLSREPNSLT